MLDKYDKHAFGNWLIIQLRNRDMTQSDLAKVAGLSRQGISGVVTGFRRPGTQVCLSIAKALNIPPEEVMAAAGILPTMKKNQTDPLWVTKQGIRMSEGGLYSVIRRLAERAGIKAPGFHDFRRAFALQSRRNGMNDSDLVKILGNSTAVLNRYLDTDDEDLRIAQEKSRSDW